jgi:hypothetical protein
MILGGLSTVAHIMLAATHRIECKTTFSFFSAASAGRVRLSSYKRRGLNHHTGSELGETGVDAQIAD